MHDRPTHHTRPGTAMIRRSRVLPRLAWLATWLAAGISTRLAGRLAAILWFVPWQDRRRSQTASTAPAVGTAAVVVDTGSGRLHGFEAGHGPTVLLVHGWADQSGSMSPFVSPLTELGHRVVAVDLPAHGANSGHRTDGFVLAHTIRDLVERFDAEVVVAHSLGALATSLALHDGLKLEGVALLAPSVRLEHALITFASKLRLPRRSVAGLRALMERRYGAGVWRALETDRLAAGFDVPALIIHDRDDRQIAVGEARRLAAAWRGAELIETSGLGHRRLLDDPQVSGLVAGFVADLALTPRQATA